MKIAILTRPDFRSPRILAESLKLQLEHNGAGVKIFDEINILGRLVSLKRSKLSFHFWLRRKVQHFFNDRRTLKTLKEFDAIIISECAPNGFLKRLYNVEKFKRIIKKPVGFYEVYYLGNAPSQIEKLKKNNDALLDRYDFHFSIANLTEIKQPNVTNWYSVGIRANSWKLQPLPKKELIAILDFVFPGNEKIREAQISALSSAGIKYISLDKPYTFDEIRNIYQQGAIYFMQSYEAFGLPLLECFCCGCQVFTPESWWPMSWRLNENPEVHGKGILPDCFTVYKDEDQLERELIAFKVNYDLTETPKKVCENFLLHYPEFYYGNENELKRFLEKIDAGADRSKRPEPLA